MSTNEALPNMSEQSVDLLYDSLNSMEGIKSLSYEHEPNKDSQDTARVTNHITPQDNARSDEEDQCADDDTLCFEQGPEDQTNDSVYSDTACAQHVRHSPDLSGGDSDRTDAASQNSRGNNSGDSVNHTEKSVLSRDCSQDVVSVQSEHYILEEEEETESKDSGDEEVDEAEDTDGSDVEDFQSDQNTDGEGSEDQSVESSDGYHREQLKEDSSSEKSSDLESLQPEERQIGSPNQEPLSDIGNTHVNQEKVSDVQSIQSEERHIRSPLNSENRDSEEDIYEDVICGIDLSRASTAQKEKKSVSFNETVGFISLGNSSDNSEGGEDNLLDSEENNFYQERQDDDVEELDGSRSPQSDSVSNRSVDVDSLVEDQEAEQSPDSDVGCSDDQSDHEQLSPSLQSLDVQHKERDCETLHSPEEHDAEKPQHSKEYIKTVDSFFDYTSVTYSEDDYSSGTFETESVTSLLDRIDKVIPVQERSRSASPAMESKRDDTAVEVPSRKGYPYVHELKSESQNVHSLQNTLSDIFRKSAVILEQYKTQLTTQQLKDFALNLDEFRNYFSALTELFSNCEKLSLSMNKELKEIRHVTDDVCNLINRKFRDEDLETWLDRDQEYLDKERLEEERIGANKALLAKAAEARCSSAKAVTVATETDKIIADIEAEAAEAELAAKKAKEVAEDALQAAEEAAKAAEERKKAEDEARRRAEERARLKAEEERKRKEEEEKRFEEEARKRGTSVDVERSREEEERARREAERKNPNNWPRYIYSIDPGDFDPGIGCIVRAVHGSLDRDDIEVQRVDQDSGIFRLRENEELISNIIEVKQTNAEKELMFEEPFSLVIPHCAPRASQGREPVVKWYSRIKEEWLELPTSDVIIEDIKDSRFVEARGTEFGLFAVVYRFKREHFTFTKKGGKLSSTVDTRFTMTTKPGAFRYNVGITTEIQPVDSNTVSELRLKSPEDCGGLMASTPIIKVMWNSVRKLPKPVTVTLPCPPNHSRTKRPSTAITRDKMDKSDMRPQTARSLSGFRKKEDDAKRDDELHLLYKDEANNWVKMPDVTLVQAKNKDIVSFDMTQPTDRFAVLRTKLDLADYQVEKMIAKLEKTLLQRDIQIFLRQRRDDLSEIVVSCAISNKVDRALRLLAEDGYDEGSGISKNITVKEGQVLEIRFRGNLAPDTDNLRTRFPFNSHIPCHIEFGVEELDKFAQRGFDSYRGFCQVFTEGLVPKIVQDPEERESRNAPKNQPVKIEMVDGEILLCELLMGIPKPEPEPPKPLLTAPLSINKEGPVNEEVFRFISRELGDEWKKLAQYLSVRRMRIQAILRQNVNAEKQQTIYDMLVSWSKRIPKAMDKVEMLCQALCYCGRGDLAEVLRERNMEFKREMSYSARDSYLKEAFIKVSRDEKVSTDWKSLAKRLGLPDRTLHEIERSRPTRQDRCYSSLQKWRDMNADSATIPNLSAKLKECRYRGLAREIGAIS